MARFGVRGSSHQQNQEQLGLVTKQIHDGRLARWDKQLPRPRANNPFLPWPAGIRPLLCCLSQGWHLRNRKDPYGNAQPPPFSIWSLWRLRPCVPLLQNMPPPVPPATRGRGDTSTASPPLIVRPAPPEPPLQPEKLISAAPTTLTSTPGAIATALINCPPDEVVGATSRHLPHPQPPPPLST
jgi:hypothetical protein